VAHESSDSIDLVDNAPQPSRSFESSRLRSSCEEYDVGYDSRLGESLREVHPTRRPELDVEHTKLESSSQLACLSDRSHRLDIESLLRHPYCHQPQQDGIVLDD
jgi:hypothetical protein